MRKTYLVYLTASYPEICRIGSPIILDYSIQIDYTKVSDSDLDLSRHLLDTTLKMLINSHFI